MEDVLNKAWAQIKWEEDADRSSNRRTYRGEWIDLKEGGTETSLTGEHSRDDRRHQRRGQIVPSKNMF